MGGDRDLTNLIRRMQAGEKKLSSEVFARVYDELRAVARSKMSNERPGHTLQPTALVNEAYLRLMGHDGSWANRAHFYAAAAEAMRRILIEHARARGREKRGGGRDRVPLMEADLPIEMDPETILTIDEALCRMEEEDPKTARVVRLRFYAGLSVEETAHALDVSVSTVMRDWAYARAWLFRALGGDRDGSGTGQGDL